VWTASEKLGWADIERMLTQTHYGQVWLVRAAIAILLFLLLTCRYQLLVPFRQRVMALAIFLLSLMHGMGSAFSGHAVSAEPTEWALSAQVVHILGAGAWAGGLPALLAGLWLAAHSSETVVHDYFSLALRQFSVLATYGVLLVMGSGVVMTYLQLGVPMQWPGGMQGFLPGLFTWMERVFAPLLSTPYGQLVLIKTALLGMVIMIAARVRLKWMPRLGQDLKNPRGVFSGMVALVACELALVLLILLTAAMLWVSVPAAHANMVWPFAWRLSVAATWDMPGTSLRVGFGLVMVALGCLMLLVNASTKHRRFLGRLLQPASKFWIVSSFWICGLAIGLPALMVDAYPDTFRRSDSAYTAISIAQGAQIFERHCVSCHGLNGKGDGPAAAGLPKTPANLTEPHTALHTAGDMYWWLTHGMVSGGMPGFAVETTDQERWDLVNFLRAFSSGFQARILKPEVVPGKPWLAWPDLSFTTNQAAAGALKDYREHDAVLLVFYALPTSQERINALVRAYPTLREKHTHVLAIPWSATSVHMMEAFPLTQINDGADEAVNTALLFSRTLSNPGETVL
jgi:putative copper resistance protein D